MKKIIAAFDALKLSASTKDYTIDLAKEIPATITGIFIENQTEHIDGTIRTIGEKKKLNAGHQKDRKEVLKTFETSCRDAHVNYTLNRDHQLPIHELLNESIYADLLVINVNETFTPYPQAPPTRFIRQLLAETQCPVFVVPDNYSHVEKVVLLYDGSPSSVYAIKVFNYLFKNQKSPEVEVITVMEHEEDGHMANGKLIREFMNRHYPQATYTMLKGQPEDTISEYISKLKGNALVVMGGYQRSSVLKSFKVTVTDTLMRKLKFQLFIAFNK
jgi:nucleotide-binding universal stress UspA family protein